MSVANCTRRLITVPNRLSLKIPAPPFMRNERGRGRKFGEIYCPVGQYERVLYTPYTEALKTKCFGIRHEKWMPQSPFLRRDHELRPQQLPFQFPFLDQFISWYRYCLPSCASASVTPPPPLSLSFPFPFLPSSSYQSLFVIPVRSSLFPRVPSCRVNLPFPVMCRPALGPTTSPTHITSASLVIHDRDYRVSDERMKSLCSCCVRRQETVMSVRSVVCGSPRTSL